MSALSPKLFRRLQDLDDHVQAEVRERLLLGHSAPAVVKLLHGSGQLTHQSVDALERQLRRYRERVLWPGLGDGTYHLPAEASRIDVIRELNKLVHRQERRVAKLLRQEEKLPVLLAATGRELDRLMKLLGTLARLQLETGVLRRAPRVMTGVVTVETPGSEVADPCVVSFRIDDEMELLPEPKAT